MGIMYLGILALFIMLCFRSFKLVKEKFGLFACLVLVFGLLSFMNNPDDDEKKSNIENENSWQFTSPDSLDISTIFVIGKELQNNLISAYNLHIRFAKEKNSNLIHPVSAYAFASGTTVGTKWKMLLISVNRIGDSNEFEYDVTDRVEWKILGLTIIRQANSYKGRVVANKKKIFM